MDTMGNVEIAKEQFEEIRSKIRELIKEAQKISDETGVEFNYEPDNIGTYYPAGSEDHPYAYGGTHNVEGEWYPSSWSSSSLYC